MSKRIRTSQAEKWIKEGRGTGIGSDYKPWSRLPRLSRTIISNLIGSIL